LRPYPNLILPKFAALCTQKKIACVDVAATIALAATNELSASAVGVVAPRHDPPRQKAALLGRC